MSQTKVEAPFVANNFAHFKNLVINGDFRVFQMMVLEQHNNTQ
jgi:hypothetical protein